MSASAPGDDRAEPFERPIGEALGGPLGIAESTLPSVAFVAVVTIAGEENLRLAVMVAIGIASVLALARAARRQTPIYALSGVIGVALSGYVVSKTGKAEGFFLPGLLLNGAYAAGWAISIIVRWPLAGVLHGAITGRGTGWREDPARVRAYSRVSWVWVAMFSLRLAVQLPLYLAGALVALGAARLAMGLPLVALVLYVSYLLLREPDGDAAPADPHDASAKDDETPAALGS